MKYESAFGTLEFPSAQAAVEEIPKLQTFIKEAQRIPPGTRVSYDSSVKGEKTLGVTANFTQVQGTGYAYRFGEPDYVVAFWDTDLHLGYMPRNKVTVE